MGKDDRQLEAVLGALLREWANEARRGVRSGRSVVVDEVSHRAYHQEMAHSGDQVSAKAAGKDARDYARKLMGLPNPRDKAMEDLAEERKL